MPTLRPAAALLATALVASCGGGTEVLIIPLFEFGFSGTAGPGGATTVQVFFSPDTPTTTTGSFDAVNMNIDALPQVHYTGSWSACSFQLKLDPASSVKAPIATNYNGRFVGNDSIELTPTSGAGLPTLTLKRQSASQRQMGC
ncbi:hypothetical protein [Pelomonas cellulosilytica]|uniref:Lipoprotein n=1 Tax=Pelomonas cellulosilytica TaxID=2906762 RepID=A0ABS8XX30_9BURK|nr:hypothetical protein [Pelomonas sp. P8]MCE4553845.1 hypothetical protein [Pelomonas sp. P8]